MRVWIQLTDEKKSAEGAVRLRQAIWRVRRRGIVRSSVRTCGSQGRILTKVK